MKAVRIHEHGDPAVLSLDDVPTPAPGPGECLVRVLATSINHLDLWVRRGMPGVKIPFPRVLGCDGTGEVVELGEGVREPAVGTKVLIEPGMSSGTSAWDERGLDHLAPDYGIRGEHGDGVDQDYLAIAARYLRPLPEHLDPVTTAATPLVFLTAWGMLVTRALLERGETVLVLGGSGGVGSAAIQIAKDRGARVVATARGEEKLALASDLGADEVVDHGREDWPKEVRRLTDGRGCDVVVEHVGPATWKGSMSCVARLGRLVTCGGTTGAVVQIALPHLFIKNQTILGSTMGPRSAFDEILLKLERGVYRPVIDSIVPMSEVRAAHERLEAREALGKIVLVPGA